MTGSIPQPDDPSSAHRLPRHTTPTWEVELLISGVAVFAMLQLPGWLDDRYFALMPRFDSNWLGSLSLLYVYLKSAALILAATFSLHLLLRARWIAQVGMHSVFPEGIRWDKLRIGPVQREIEIQRYRGPEASIERADNAATVVFAIGVMLATTLLWISLLVVCLSALALGFVAFAGSRVGVGTALACGVLVLFLPAILATVIDRRVGAKLREGGVARRALAAVLRISSRLGFMQRGSNPVFSLLASHGGERRAVALTIAVFLIAALVVRQSIRSEGDPRSFGSYTLFPALADRSRTLEDAHYDDLRDPARDAAVPYIDSMVASGPYLRLVVPYVPRWDADVLEHDCPTMARAAGEDARAAAALGCLQRAHAVLLDDKPLPSLRYEPGNDPRTERPALVAMIDVRGLPVGRHELQVARAPGRVAGDATDDGLAPWKIPFWR